MSNDNRSHDEGRERQHTSRRHELRNLLLSAADAARKGRLQKAAARLGGPLGRAVRDRVSMLLNAAA